MKILFCLGLILFFSACSREENREQGLKPEAPKSNNEILVSLAAQNAPPAPTLDSSPVVQKTPELIEQSMKAWPSHKISQSVLNTPDSMGLSLNGKVGFLLNDHNEIMVWETHQPDSLETLQIPDFQSRSAALNAEGNRLALGGTQSRVILWSLIQKKIEMTLNVGPKSASQMAFSKNGKWLAIGTLDYKIQLWNLETGKKVREWVTRNGDMVGSGSGMVASLDFAMDDQILVVQEFFTGQYEQGRSITLWDVQEGYEVSMRPLAPPNSGPNERMGVSLGGNGKLLAYTTQKGLIAERLEDCGKTVHRFGEWGGYADIVAADPGGKWIATVDHAYHLYFTPIHGKTEDSLLWKLPAPITGLKVHPDGKNMLVLLSLTDKDKNSIPNGGMLYQMEIPEEMRNYQGMNEIQHKVKCGPSEIAKMEMRFKMPEKLPELLEVAKRSREELQPPLKAGVAPDQNPPVMVVGMFLDSEGKLKVLSRGQGSSLEGMRATHWDLKSGKTLQSRIVKGDEIALLPGDWLMSDWDGNWSSALGNHQWSRLEKRDPIPGGSEKESSEGVRDIFAVDPDQGDVYRIRGGGQNMVHDSGTGKPLGKIKLNGKKVLAMSARNGRVAWIYEDYTGEIMDPTYQERKTFGPLVKEGGCDIDGIYLSPVGRFIQASFDCGDGGALYGSLDLVSKKWNSDSKYFMNPLPFRASKGVVRGERRAQLAIVDLGTSSIVGRLPPNPGDPDDQYGMVVSAMSDDGKRVASGSTDGLIYVWDIDSGKLLGASKHEKGIDRLVFDPKGGRLAVANRLGEVKIFEIQEPKD